MTREEALARCDLASLLVELGDLRGLQATAPHTPRGKYACPDLGHAQTGDSPPCSISERPNGVDVWHCHSCERGGSYIDALVVSERAATLAEALESIGVEKTEREQTRAGGSPGTVVAEYVYRDAGGDPRLKVVRFEPKDFRQMRWEDGRWQWGVRGVDLVPYRLPEALAAFAAGRPVFVVEGEKDADALAELGHAATCNPGGAGKWRPEYTAALAGASHRVVVIADDDDPGHRHAVEVWRSFQGRVGQCVARLPAEGHGDVREQLSAGVEFVSATLRRLPALAEPPQPSASAASGPMFLTARALAARPSQGDAAQVVGPLFQRGMRTTIGAGTGEGKTSLSLQAIKSLIHRTPFVDDTWVPLRPGRALIIDLEQGEEVVKRRLREAGLDNSDAVDVLWEPAGLALDTDLEHQRLVRNTIEQGGYDLVLVDPLYQMHRGSGNDEQLAASLMNLVDSWARDFNFSLVIPMHARKPHPDAKKNMTIHDIAGSGSWNRNAEFVLGLQVMSAGMSRVHFFKDRVGDGPPLQSKWWMKFNRVDGFAHVPDPHSGPAAAERTAAIQRLLAHPEGTTEDLLREAGATDHTIRRIRREAFQNEDGRWRSTDWNQTSLADDTGAFDA